MKLEDIGFYTLSDERARNASQTSPLQRCELILTDRCNLACPYCRGLEDDLQGDIPLAFAQEVIQMWTEQGLVNCRLSGGEPTLYPHLDALVKGLASSGVKRIALSTNGMAALDRYMELVKLGVNDFSISLDAGCCSIGTTMTGGCGGAWEKASNAIKELSKITYVTVGVVFNEANYSSATKTLEYIDTLNPSDIRVIPSAQYDQRLLNLSELPTTILKKYPILRYRIENLRKDKSIRGLNQYDSCKCAIVLDDMAVVKNYHYPCIIYLREQGEPIGKMTSAGEVRKARAEWYANHNVKKDPICSKNCLDVCSQYNRTVRNRP